MIERRQRSGFAREARGAFGVGRECLWQDLQRNVAQEFGISRAIHLPHPTLAQLGDDFVLADLAGNHVNAP